MISSTNIRLNTSPPTSKLLSTTNSSNNHNTTDSNKGFSKVVTNVHKTKEVKDNNDVNDQAKEVISQLLSNLQNILQNNKLDQSDNNKKSDSINGTDNSTNQKLETVLSSLSPSDKQRVMNDVQKLMDEMKKGSMDSSQQGELSNILNMLGQNMSSGEIDIKGLNPEELKSKLEEVANKISEASKADNKSNQSEISKISDVVSNVISKISSSKTTNNETADAKQGNKIGDVNLKTSVDSPRDNSLFKIILDNSNSESKGDMNKKGEESSSLLSEMATPKEDKNDKETDFSSLLQGTSFNVSHSDGISKDAVNKTSETKNNVLQSDVSHETNNNSPNISQSKNLSLTVSTGDDQPVRVQINRTEAGISSLSLQAADEHTTESLQKTQHILSHQLEMSGIHPSSVKITVLPTDTGNQTNTNSQNMNQNSFFQQNGSGFSSNSGGEHQGHRNEIQYYGNSLGNIGADDVSLDDETSDLTEYRGLNIKV